MPNEPPFRDATAPSSKEIERLKLTPGARRVLEVIERLDQFYDDFSPKFLEQFPDNLPKKFPLKIGANVVGNAEVDWKRIGGHLFWVLVIKPKPEDISEDDYIQAIADYLYSLDAKEKATLTSPTLTIVSHLLKFLPEKINDAIVQLAVEGRQKVVIEQQKELGRHIPSRSKFAAALLKRERAAILRRLPYETRGGSAPRLPDDERMSLHTQYDILHNLAKRIKRDYNAELKRFAQSRKAKGYSRKEWRDHWLRHATYPSELTDMCVLFANQDNPSASDVAYSLLSTSTGYKRSYLQRLVASSRKARPKDRQ